jgi:hypothetical protein
MNDETDSSLENFSTSDSQNSRKTKDAYYHTTVENEEEKKEWNKPLGDV